MGDQLGVDPVDLHMSSDHMDMHHADLSAAHAAADADIEAAQSGWVGASAAALRAKFAEWQSASQEMQADVAAHGTAFRTAAHGYTTVDTESSEAIQKSSEAIQKSSEAIEKQL